MTSEAGKGRKKVYIFRSPIFSIYTRYRQSIRWKKMLGVTSRKRYKIYDAVHFGFSAADFELKINMQKFSVFNHCIETYCFNSTVNYNLCKYTDVMLL